MLARERSCAQSVFLWAQLKGDTLQALLNILGVEVVLAALSELDWDDAIANVIRSCQACDAGSRSQSGVCDGGGSLENNWLTCQ